MAQAGALRRMGAFLVRLRIADTRILTRTSPQIGPLEFRVMHELLLPSPTDRRCSTEFLQVPLRGHKSVSLRFGRRIGAFLDCADFAQPSAAPLTAHPPPVQEEASIVASPFANRLFLTIDHLPL